MHLIESQSTQSGQSIDKLEIYEKYFPLPFTEEYLVFAPYSKDSKNYDYWADVINILSPVLDKNNIKIVQIGSSNEKPYKNCYYIAGQTSINQVAFLIKNSIGVLSTDTFSQHMADGYNIKSTVLISNNYSNNVRGYFNPNNQIVLEPNREDGEKPCLALQENPKSINKIKIEDIVAAACKMLDLEHNFLYQTIYIGEIYNNPMIIGTCDSIIDPRQVGTDSLIVDLTINNKQDLLLQQLNICHCSVIINKPLDNKILEFHRVSKRIKEIVYEITDDNDPEFAKSVIKAGINLKMISKLSVEKISELKLNYMDIGIIRKLSFINPNNTDSLKNEDLNNLYIKSGKFYLSGGLVYPSKSHLAAKKPVKSFDDIVLIENNDLFWQEAESMRILKKIDIS